MVQLSTTARLLMSCLLLGGFLALAGCEEEKGPLEKAGEAADEALQDAAKTADEAVEGAKEAIKKATEE